MPTSTFLVLLALALSFLASATGGVHGGGRIDVLDATQVRLAKDWSSWQHAQSTPQAAPSASHPELKPKALLQEMVQVTRPPDKPSYAQGKAPQGDPTHVKAKAKLYTKILMLNCTQTAGSIKRDVMYQQKPLVNCPRGCESAKARTPSHWISRLVLQTVLAALWGSGLRRQVRFQLCVIGMSSRAVHRWVQRGRALAGPSTLPVHQLAPAL